MRPSIQFILVSFLSHPCMVKFRERMLLVDVVVCLEHDLVALWSLLGSGFWTLWKPVAGSQWHLGGSVFGLEVSFVLDFDNWSMVWFALACLLSTQIYPCLAGGAAPTAYFWRGRLGHGTAKRGLGMIRGLIRACNCFWKNRKHRAVSHTFKTMTITTCQFN